MWETQVHSLGWEDPLEKGMATYSSTLAWWIPWTEKPGGLQFEGRTESDMTEAAKQQHMDSGLFHFFIQDQKWGGILCSISYFYAFSAALNLNPTLKKEPYFFSFMKKVYKTKFTAHVCL